MWVVGDLSLRRLLGVAAHKGLNEGLWGVLGGLSAQGDLKAVQLDRRSLRQGRGAM